MASLGTPSHCNRFRIFLHVDYGADDVLRRGFLWDIFSFGHDDGAYF